MLEIVLKRIHQPDGLGMIYYAHVSLYIYTQIQFEIKGCYTMMCVIVYIYPGFRNHHIKGIVITVISL